MRKYAITAAALLIARDGTLAAVGGSQNENGAKTRYVQAALDALLAGQPVSTKTTEPVGGAITRRVNR